MQVVSACAVGFLILLPKASGWSGRPRRWIRGRASEISAAAVRELARLKGATLVFVDERVAVTWRPILRPLGTPQAVDGTLVYRLTRLPAGRLSCRPA